MQAFVETVFSPSWAMLPPGAVTFIKFKKGPKIRKSAD